MTAADSREHNGAHWDAIEEATELLRDGDPAAAERALRAELDGDPGNPYAHYYLGSLHFARGEFEPARVCYLQALRCAPAYLGALVGLGHALRMLRRFDEAVRVGERALGLGTDARGDPDAHYLLGLTHAARGSLRLAVGHLEAFLAANPDAEAVPGVDALLQALRERARPVEPA